MHVLHVRADEQARSSQVGPARDSLGEALRQLAPMQQILRPFARIDVVHGPVGAYAVLVCAVHFRPVCAQLEGALARFLLVHDGLVRGP